MILCETGGNSVQPWRGVYRGRGKKPLMPALPFRPLLVKPNQKELEEMAGHSISSLSELVGAAQYLQEQGARNVLVSLGKEGAYFLGENGGRYFLDAPKGTVINTVGSGDSMIAGFLSKYLKGESLLRAACYGVAAGSARAFPNSFGKRSGGQTQL